MHAPARPDETELIEVDEAGARRLLLARAVDETDTQGRLVGAVERDQLEREALEATGEPAQGRRLDAKAYLLARADRLLALLAHRQPGLLALQEGPPWQRWIGWGLPLLALVLGALADRIDNPRQVNLLSPPLLAFLLWNLAVYLLLVVMAVWPRTPGAPRGSILGRWAGAFSTRRIGGLRAAITARFRSSWWRFGGTLEGQRWRRVLHTSAAAWAVGVALSIAVGGLVREYRIGWESTLLDLPQVHAFLSLLFAPVVALLPLEPFSMAELQRLHFGTGTADVGRAEARRWVFLYIALLALLVMLPRAVLAAWAGWRQHRLSRAIAVDLGDPYFTELLGRVRPARVLVAWLDGVEDAAALQTVLRQTAGEGHAHVRAGEPWTLLTTARDDSLQWVAVPPAGRVVQDSPGRGWSRLVPRIAGWSKTDQAAALPAQADVVAIVCAEVGELESRLPELKAAARPVLLLPTDGQEGAYAATLRRLDVACEVLPLQALPTWREDVRLRAALQRLLPPYKAPGMERLSALWQERARSRLADAMRLLARELVLAARDTQELSATPLGVRQLVVRGERESGQEARRLAMSALLARMRERQAAGDARLLALHALEGVVPETVLEHALPERFRVRQSVHEPQAGLAGAASGAAMGVTIDLMTGGLTLGAASALGALVGGGAALVAAAWKNRSSEPGRSVVALSDEMLVALLQGALLRYLGVIHEGRASTPADRDRWPAAVEAVVLGDRDALRAVWAELRTRAEAEDVPARLAQQLQELVLRLLQDLHGPLPPG